MSQYTISNAMMNRLPLYLNYLENAKQNGVKSVSATIISKDLGLGEVLVRKELGVVSGKGKPRVGYKVNSLLKDFDNFFHTNKTSKAVIVGAGKLGRALMGYKRFSHVGVEILGAFDSDVDKIDNKKIFSINKLKKFIEEKKVQIGIITVPRENAIEAYNLLLDAGVKAIWNFAPIELKSTENVIVKQENLALSLAYLNIMYHKKAKDSLKAQNEKR